jgi:hypothetical protein
MGKERIELVPAPTVFDFLTQYMQVERMVKIKATQTQQVAQR